MSVWLCCVREGAVVYLLQSTYLHLFSACSSEEEKGRGGGGGREREREGGREAVYFWQMFSASVAMFASVNT